MGYNQTERYRRRTCLLASRDARPRARGVVPIFPRALRNATRPFSSLVQNHSALSLIYTKYITARTRNGSLPSLLREETPHTKNLDPISAVLRHTKPHTNVLQYNPQMMIYHGPRFSLCTTVVLVGGHFGSSAVRGCTVCVCMYARARLPRRGEPVFVCERARMVSGIGRGLRCATPERPRLARAPSLLVPYLTLPQRSSLSTFTADCRRRRRRRSVAGRDSLDACELLQPAAIHTHTRRRRRMSGPSTQRPMMTMRCAVVRCFLRELSERVSSCGRKVIWSASLRVWMCECVDSLDLIRWVTWGFDRV